MIQIKYEVNFQLFTNWPRRLHLRIVLKISLTYIFCECYISGSLVAVNCSLLEKKCRYVTFYVDAAAESCLNPIVSWFAVSIFVK